MAVPKVGSKWSSRPSPGSVPPRLPTIGENPLEMMRPPPDALQHREPLPMRPADPGAPGAPALAADRGTLQAIGDSASGAVRCACEGLARLSSCCRKAPASTQERLEAAQAERRRLRDQLLLAGSHSANQSPVDRLANAVATRRAQARLRTLAADIPALLDARLREVMADGEALIRRGAGPTDLDEIADEQFLLLQQIDAEQTRQATPLAASLDLDDDGAEQKW